MTGSALDEFLEGCCEEMERRAFMLDDPASVFVAGAQAFRKALDAATPVARPPARVPVADLLTGSHESTLINLLATAVEVPWAPTPRLEDSSGDVVALGLIDTVRDLGTLQCGVMLLAPGARYPEHSHPPQEVYLPLAGNGTWRSGGAEDYRSLGPDELIYNNPGDRHGTVAGDELEVALYILW